MRVRSSMSRREALSLLGLLIGPAALGCVSTIEKVRTTDFRRLDRNRVLLVGRVRVRQVEDLTASTAIETNEGGLGGYQLDAAGTVAWLIDRPGGELRIAWLSSSKMMAAPTLRDAGAIHLGDRGPLVMPRGADTPIVHFGKISFVFRPPVLSPFEQEADDRLGFGPNRMHVEMDDGGDDILPALLATNPTLNGIAYLHVPSGKYRRVQAGPFW